MTKTTLSDLKDAIAEKDGEGKKDETEGKAEGKTETGTATAAVSPATPLKPILDAKGRSYGTGRRKDAVARVWLSRGSGKITVNGRDILQYFARGTQRLIINQAFEVTNRVGQFDINCFVKGGGLSGQAGAVRHGLSRALVNFEPDLRPALKAVGFMTRDSRIVERKKYGRHKARKSTQWVKR